MTVFLKNGSVLDVDTGRYRQNTDILIEKSTIKAMGQIDIEPNQGITSLDCSQKYILPGFFECHTHLAHLTEEGNDRVQQVLNEFVAGGITSIRDVGGPLPLLKSIKENISNGLYPGPEIYYAGPMLEKSPLFWSEFNEKLPGFTVSIDSLSDAKQIIKDLVAGGARLVKTFNKFENNVFQYLVQEATAMNLPVTHDPGMPLFHAIPMDKGIEVGIRCFEHGKAPWPLVLTDDLKSKHDILLHSDASPQDFCDFTDHVFSYGIQSISLPLLEHVIQLMIDNEVFLCPTLNIFKGFEEPPSEDTHQIEQKKRKEAMNTMYSVSRFLTEHMAKQKVKILVGQDGCLPQQTFQEMFELHDCGLSELEIIRGSTLYPAEWLGVGDHIGSIAVNKQADMVILQNDPLQDIHHMQSVQAVIQKGIVVHREKSDKE